MWLYIRPSRIGSFHRGSLWNPLTRTSFSQRAQNSQQDSGLASPGPTCSAITLNYQRNLRRSIPYGVNPSRSACHSGRPHTHVFLPKRPVVGQYCPDRPGHFVCQSDNHHVKWPAFADLFYPRAWLLGGGQDTARTMNEQRAQIPVALLADVVQVHLATRTGLPGHQAGHAANSRSELNDFGSPIIATAAVAVSNPTPGTSLIAFKARFSLTHSRIHRSMLAICSSSLVSPF